MLPNLGWAQQTCQTGPSCLAISTFSAVRIPSQNLDELLLLAFDLEQTDGAIRRASGKSFSVIVQLNIVLEEHQYKSLPPMNTYNHILMLGIERARIRSRSRMKGESIVRHDRRNVRHFSELPRARKIRLFESN